MSCCNGDREGMRGAGITRRGFIMGSAAVTGLALSGAGFLSGCSNGKDTDVEVLEVDEKSVFTLDSFKNYKSVGKHCTVSELARFDKGTQLNTSGKRYAAALCPGATANPLNTIGLVNLETGALTTVLEKAVEQDAGYNIYDVFSSDKLLVWVESNFLTSDWAVYCAAIKGAGTSLGQAVKVDSGGADYDAPDIAAIAQTAYWIVQPAEDGSKTKEDSLLKAAVGGSGAATVHTSHGRFNGGLSASGQVLTAMPRADVSGVYYQLTAFQTGTGAIVASQIMPKSFRPSCAVYMNGSFSFSIGASYDYGGGIANVGTYYPMGDGTWLRLSRQPVTPPALCNGWLCCKSGSRTVLVDLQNRGYLTIDAPDGASDYGDYPANTGDVKQLYTYATVSKVVKNKESSEVVLRRILPKEIG